MGEIIVRKVRGMNWKAKISLVLIFTMVFSTFMYQGLYKPKPANAAVAVLQAFPNTPTITAAATTASGTFTVSAGTNRLLLVAVEADSGNTNSGSFTVTYGGQTLTQIVVSDVTQRRMSWLGYLKESQIAAASNTTLAVTASPLVNTTPGIRVYASTLTGVDQTTPVSASYSIYDNNSTAVFSYSLAVQAGGYGVFAITANNANAPTITVDTGYTVTSVSAASPNTNYSICGSKTYAAAGNAAPTITYPATVRGGIAAATINPAATDATPPTAGTVTVSPDTGTYTSAAPTVTTAFTDNESAVTTCQYTTNNGTAWTAGTVSGAGPYTCTANPTGLSGALTINMRATSSGGTGTATAVPRTVDATSPTNGTLTVTAGSGQNSLSWSGFSDAASGLASTGTYILRFATGATAPANCTSGTAVTGSPFALGTTSTTHTGLTNGTQYSYRLCAVDAVNNTSTGATGWGTPQACTDPDSAVLAITNPATASTISGTVNVQMSVATETSPATMTTVEFQINGTWRAATWNAGNSRWEYSWNSKLDYPGTGTPIAVTINAHGTDIDCNTVKTASVSFNVNNPVTLSANIASCAGCHGYTSAFPDGTARNTPAGAFPGSHDKHVVQYGKICSTCHTAPATETSADYKHRNGTVDIATTINGAGTYSRTSFAQSNGAFAPGNCSNTYCHSNGTSATTPAGAIPTNTSPSWGGTTACNSCHGVGGAADGRPNYTPGTPKVNAHQASTHSLQTCDVCHDSVTYSGGTYTPDPTKHNNGVYNLNTSLGYTPGTAAAGGTCATPSCHGSINWGGSLGCKDCHSAAINSPVAQALDATVTQRVAITPDFSLTSRHIRSRTASPAVTNNDCGVCHMEGNASDGSINSTYHKNGYIELRDPDLGTTIKGVTHSGTTSAPGVYTSTATDARPVRFSRNLGSATLEADTQAIMVNMCLKCHDTNGANSALARVPGATAGQPFGAAIAANPGGNVLDVAAQFASTNRSFHPVLVRQNNGYVNTGGTRMVAPWNGVATTATTTVYGPLITCWDCHAPNGSTAATILTSSGVHGGTPNGTDAVELRGNVYVNGTTAATNLCVGCHVVSGGTTNHGTGSAITSSTNSGMTYFQNRCYFCHASDVSRTRPWGAGDAHGYNARGGVAAGGTAFPAVNNGYAFLRSEGWYAGTGTQSIRSIGATTYTPTCGGRVTTGGGAGSCSRGSMGGYTPGGVY